MRLLHTSDWHLGASIKQVDCRAEQERFLDWLVGALAEREVDVLVVAGDVFHYSTPSNAAQALYYDFLVRCARLDTLQKVVVVAGNHDSPTGLEAPQKLLGHLDVHVVGALPRDEDRWEECLVPVEADDGGVEMVVAAVPYVQEARLGVSLGDGGESDLREQYQEAFGRLYGRLADLAEQRWPNAKLVATGHLTVYGEDHQPEEGDYHTGIHRTVRPNADWEDEQTESLRNIGTIEAMSPTIFDDRFDYVALGHIHRPMPVGGTRHIRYSGTPVATSLAEHAPGRRVLQIDFEAGIEREDMPIESVSVPTWREIFELEGSEDELAAQLETMQSDAQLPPAVFLRVQLGIDDEPGADRLGRFKQVIDDNHPSGQRPVIVELREALVEVAADGGARADKLPPIEELTHLEVFEAMYRRRYPERESPPERLIKKFREIEQLLHDTDEGAQ